MTNRIEKNRTEYNIPCNLCGSLSVEILFLTDRNGHYFRTVICKKCGFIWSDPHPAEENIKGFYSKEYRKKYKGIRKPKKKTTVLTRHTNFRHFTTIVPYKKFILNSFIAIKEQIDSIKFSHNKEGSQNEKS